MGITWGRIKEKCSAKKFLKKWKTYSKKKKAILITAAAVVFLAAAGGGVLYFGRNTDRGLAMDVAVTEVTASSGAISNTVVGTGNLEADTSNSLKIPSGLVIDEVLVESGDHVAAGDTLAIVNEASILTTLASVQESIANLDKEILTVQTGSEEEEITAGVSGRVKKIFAAEGSDAADCILDNGALMLLSVDGKMAVDFTSAEAVAKGSTVTVVTADGTAIAGTVESVSGNDCTVTFSDLSAGLDESVNVTGTSGTALGSGLAYIHQEIQVTATGGTVSDLCVAENEAIGAGDTLLVLESNTQSVQYKALTVEREAMAETLKKLLAISKTGEITAEMDGTVETINISSGSSSGSSTSQSSNSSTQSSSAVSHISYTEDSEVIPTDGTAAITFLTADVTGTGDVISAADTGESEETGENEEADTNAIDKDMSVDAGTTKLEFAVCGSGCSSFDTLVITQPAKGQEPQTKIDTADGSYTGVITWTPQDTAFQASTVYKAEVTLYAAEAYRFEADSITSVEMGVASGITVSDNQKTLSFQLTFPETEKDKSDDKDTSAPDEQNKGDDTGSAGGSTDKYADNGAAGSGNNTAGTGGSTSVSGGNGSSGTASSGTASGGSGTTGSTSSTDAGTDSTGYSTDITAFGIASDNNMILSVSVDELDINSISKTQEAEVTLDAIEDQTFTGTVTRVGNSGSTSGGVTKYTVQITIPKDRQMKSGMNASATIVIEKKENVVTVPVNALQERGGETFVYTQKSSDGSLSGEKTVTTGISDGDMVEITEGLSEGDTVYYQKTGNTGSSSNMGGGGMPEGGGFERSSEGGSKAPDGAPGGQEMPSRQ